MGPLTAPTKRVYIISDAHPILIKQDEGVSWYAHGKIYKFTTATPYWRYPNNYHKQIIML